MKAAGWNSALQAVKLVPKFIALANDFIVRSKIDKELARMAPEIRKVRGSTRGVLVIAQIREWDMPDTAGTRAKQFYEILIGPAGNDFREVYRSFMMNPCMHSGPGMGWRFSPKYLWVTAA